MSYLWILAIPVWINLYLLGTDVEFLYFWKDLVQVSWFKAYFGFIYYALRKR